MFARRLLPAMGFSLGLSAFAQQAYDPSYAVEILGGPVTGSDRITGMGGAMIGIAEGSAAQSFNPAAVANRTSDNGDKHFDYDIDYSFVQSLGGSSTRIENNGLPNTEVNSRLQNISFLLNFGRFGIGIDGEISTYIVCSYSGGTSCPISSQVIIEGITPGINLGWNFFRGQLVAGYRINVPIIYLANPGDPAPAAQTSVNSTSSEFGLLWRPQKESYRVGFTVHQGGASSLSPNGSSQLNGVSLPQNVESPWEIGAGFSYMFGPREYNPQPSFEDVKVSKPKRQRYVLVDFDLVCDFPASQAASFGAWANQQLVVVGQAPTFSARLGAEAEVLLNRLRLRLGTYTEPSRVEGVNARLHGTGGFELRLFKWKWDFQLGAALDVASNYFNGTLGLGLWH